MLSFRYPINLHSRNEWLKLIDRSNWTRKKKFVYIRKLYPDTRNEANFVEICNSNEICTGN